MVVGVESVPSESVLYSAGTREKLLGKKLACIVIPTYNEAQNITRLLEEIFEQARLYRETPTELHVLVVDDSSPDGTAQVVEDYQYRNPNVHLLVREEKEGLGKAYIAGMKHTLELLNPDAVVEMDADFSHNPKDVFRLLDAVWGGADFVIGSRYVEGGSVPDNWGRHRVLLSKGANLMTRMILGIKGVKDCSGGFRAINTRLLRSIDLDSLNVKGYAFQAVILEAAMSLGGVVREVPIHFANREKGKSKMRLKDMVEGFTVLGRVRARRLLGKERSSPGEQE